MLKLISLFLKYQIRSAKDAPSCAESITDKENKEPNRPRFIAEELDNKQNINKSKL